MTSGTSDSRRPPKTIASIGTPAGLSTSGETLGQALIETVNVPGTWVVPLMTPVVEGWAETYENPAITTPKLRRLHFGQHDHVRYYGRDVRDRIRAPGFALTEVTAVEPDVLTYGLNRGETLFIATKPG